MRREISRELQRSARGLYTVDQEAVTAEENETDVRLRSTASDIEAVIEIKLADKRTAKDLKDTIRKQLVEKYMAPENRQSGCLLITLTRSREWECPDDTSVWLDEAELLELLNMEARTVEAELGGDFKLSVLLLDLKPRALKEPAPRKRKKKPN